MARFLHGITVTLYEEETIAEDSFGQPVVSKTPVDVENVLVYPTSISDQVSELDLYGKKSVYTLAIPKGDAHDWLDKDVSFFGRTFKAFGQYAEGIEAMLPLDWNRQIKVESYE